MKIQYTLIAASVLLLTFVALQFYVLPHYQAEKQKQEMKAFFSDDGQ